MRIKPYVVLGLATLFAGAGLVVIVTTSDPIAAPATMMWLFWITLFLSLWGLVSTLFSLAGQRLILALCNGVFWATAIVSLAELWRRGIASTRLSAAIVGATIVLTFILWIRLRRSDKQL